MIDLFRSIVSMEPPFNMLVLMMLFGSTAGVIGTIATQLRKHARDRGETQLKRELVERGLSVDEIERIIAAKSPNQTGDG